jgi:hypothetical protein
VAAGGEDEIDGVCAVAEVVHETGRRVGDAGLGNAPWE